MRTLSTLCSGFPFTHWLLNCFVWVCCPTGCGGEERRGQHAAALGLPELPQGHRADAAGEAGCRLGSEHVSAVCMLMCIGEGEEAGLS